MNGITFLSITNDYKMLIRITQTNNNINICNYQLVNWRYIANAFISSIYTVNLFRVC